ncbi:hypothetical protein BGZ51_008041 [Haplosporangium sp. Z 767]|nr:hypothetical protein BGZ51_008041 [Haplosporangium sp. Z 767]
MSSKDKTSGNLGAVNQRIGVHKFFKEVDARNWDRIESFFKFRDINKTAREHTEMYKQGLTIISGHNNGVSMNIRKRAQYLLRSFAYDQFMDEFATLALKVGTMHAEKSAQNLHLNVLHGAGRVMNSSGVRPDGTPEASTSSPLPTLPPRPVLLSGAESIEAPNKPSLVFTPADGDSDVVGEEETTDLLINFDQTRHAICEWKIDERCVACHFQMYQKSCAKALADKVLKKSEIADVMAIVGVFAPFLPTSRMIETFGRNTLDKLLSPVTFPEPNIDDAAVLKAVRLRINNQRDEACEALRLEQLPLKADKTVSEETFVVNHVAPLLQTTLKIDDRVNLHFPNTSSTVQKQQGLKPDRPDIAIKVHGQEVFYGEVTGPARENNEVKVKWDFFRLVRFGKAFLDGGNKLAPLIQVVYTNGTYMRLSVKTRGIYLLEEVGSFVVPTTVATIPSFLASLPTLLAAKDDLKTILDSDLNALEALNALKRSWNYEDIMNVKKKVI